MTKIIRTVAFSTIAGAVMAVTLSAADAKIPSHVDVNKKPIVEQIDRGYAPAIDIDRGWAPAELLTARGYSPEQDAERGWNPNSDTDRGANPAQFDVARGYSPNTTA